LRKIAHIENDGDRSMPGSGVLLQDWRRWLIALPRYTKRSLLIAFDSAALVFSLWFSFSLRLNTWFVPPTRSLWLMFAAAPVIGVSVFHFFGLYKLVTRYIGPEGARQITLATIVTASIWTFLFWILHSGAIVPRSSIVIFALLSGAIIWFGRQTAAWLLLGPSNNNSLVAQDPGKRIALIYGAGPTGVHLLEALRRSGDYRICGFVDDNPTLWGQVIGGLKVSRPSRLVNIVQSDGVSDILLALPEMPRQQRQSIVERLKQLKVNVKTLPSMEDIAAGRVAFTDLRPISADDLLGRERVAPDSKLLESSTRGKCVLVTGAGGSIGSEIARQIGGLGPKRLVLLDVSEPALYEIERELRFALNARRETGAQSNQGEAIVSVLGSVLDEPLMRTTIEANKIDVIYHAAAYKHVPIVEHNPVVGLRNNTFGTKALAEAAKDGGVERFVLISTDKAVRPTNIMGASKRLAELVLQSAADDRSHQTIFTMVRFGNVLDSSGSVMRLFRRQIEEGGPVTVTHPEIIRYFMAIPEAAELVIQAGAMAKGGEVFVLDMGEAVKIDSLARSMIMQMGLTVKDALHPSGDIEIVYSGLRPGEKLFEELLINENTSQTAHPRIRRSLEPGMPTDRLANELQALASAMTTADIEAIHAVLKRTVEGYVPETRHLTGRDGKSGDWQSARRTLH
jgi:FlaA1/EpsC-like NDP-sugar epimerase